jgi:hypothetical protein
MVLAPSGNSLLHRGQEGRLGSRPDSPGMQEGSRTPSRQSDSAPVDQASQQGEAPLHLLGTGRVVVLLGEGHLPRKCRYDATWRG